VLIRLAVRRRGPHRASASTGILERAAGKRMASKEAHPMATAAQRTPNLFELHGDCLAVTYSTTGLDGRPPFAYQDEHRSLRFTGEDIRSVEAEIGDLISVTLAETPDLGSTTFTLLVPAVNLAGADSAPIETEAVTTLRRTSIAPALVQGQTEIYRVNQLTGTARAVMF
jgi:hypothetical protein